MRALLVARYTLVQGVQFQALVKIGRQEFTFKEGYKIFETLNF